MTHATRYTAVACANCGHAIHPGQLWRPDPVRHVACPTERQVEQAKRMGREP
jgi:hypothetical protein